MVCVPLDWRRWLHRLGQGIFPHRQRLSLSHTSVSQDRHAAIPIVVPFPQRGGRGEVSDRSSGCAGALDGRSEERENGIRRRRPYGGGPCDSKCGYGRHCEDSAPWCCSRSLQPTMAVHASRRGLLLHRHQNLSGSRLARVRAWRRALGQCCTTPLKSAPARLTLTPHPNFRPLHPVQGAFRLIPILFEEHLGFHSGYPGPLPQIPECRPQLSDSSSQVNPQPCSSRRDNSSTQLHGINWQQQLSYLPPDVLTQATSAPLNFSDFDLSFSDGAAWSADSSSSGLQTDGLQAFPQDHIDVSLGMDAIYSLTTLSSGVFTTMPSSAPLLQTIYNTSPQISDQGMIFPCYCPLHPTKFILYRAFPDFPFFTSKSKPKSREWKPVLRKVSQIVNHQKFFYQFSFTGREAEAKHARCPPLPPEACGSNV